MTIDVAFYFRFLPEANIAETKDTHEPTTAYGKIVLSCENTPEASAYKVMQTEMKQLFAKKMNIPEHTIEPITEDEYHTYDGGSCDREQCECQACDGNCE